jgi:hypothetical protein
LKLLPFPRSLRRRPGFFTLPSDGLIFLPADLPRDHVLLPLLERMQQTVAEVGAQLSGITGPRDHPRVVIRASLSPKAPAQGYLLEISATGVAILYRDVPGLRAAIATLRQLIRQYGRRLPRLRIRDYPDFPRRGVMLDVSRGRVPRLETLLELVDHLADFKINEFQLYTEHTFAYRDYEPVWRDWGPLTAEEMLRLDARCRQLGIDLVPNQNAFGHLRYWLEFPPLKRLAEIAAPYEGAGGDFLRYPTTLAPRHPATLPFLRRLFDELLPCFTSDYFNVGCDETWDLGRGQSQQICRRQGKGRVYLGFLKKIYREVKARDRRMMFWGDIILHYPELIRELPRDVVALNWGYEANHPFDRESRLFARSKLPFYVCPGTSTWMTLIGRHDNALTNLRQAAAAGVRHRADGYLNTDWGDGGHPQPLAVSYLPYLAGAALSWCRESFQEKLLVPVLSRDIFRDSTQNIAGAAWGLGVAHRKFEYCAPNVTPFGTVIAAPPPPWRELVCRDGLKYYARIPARKIQSALDELGTQQQRLHRGRPQTAGARILHQELDLASRMAAISCQIMLWQQAVAAANSRQATQMARTGIKQLRRLQQEFNAYWPLRNKGTPAKCAPFLGWRIRDYQLGRLYFSPEQARKSAPSRLPED